MPKPRVAERQAGFAGGLNLAADPSQLKPDQSRQLENARLTQFGGVSRRLGTRRVVELPLVADVPIQNGYTWYRLTSTDILVVVNGTLYVGSLQPFTNPELLLTEGMDMLVTEDGEFLATETSYTSFSAKSGTLSSQETPDFAAFRSGSTECVYIADGGRLNRWDGTTLTTDISSTPEVVSICVYNQRLMGVTGDDQSVFYSPLNDGNGLGIGASGGGEAVIRTFSDQRTTAVATNGDTLFIFHEDGISRFTGYTQDDIAIATAAAAVTGQVGTRSPQSVVSTVMGIFFLGNDGFYRLTDGPPQRISVPIESLVRSWTGNTIRTVRGVHASAFKEVRWYVPDYGVLAWNYELNAWCGPDTGSYARTTALWESQNEAGRPTVLRGNSLGYVALCDADGIYLDDAALDGTGGDSYTMIAQCHRMFSGDPSAEKSLRFGWIVGDTAGSTGLTVKWNTGTGEQSYLVSTDSAETNLVRLPLSGRGSYVDITLEDAGAVGSSYSYVEAEGFNMGRRGP